jgi:hypothetical protein
MRNSGTCVLLPYNYNDQFKEEKACSTHERFDEYIYGFGEETGRRGTTTWIIL